MASNFRKIKKMPRFVTWLLATLIHLIRLTYRIKIVDPHNFLETFSPIPSVITLWHNRILFIADCAPQSMRQHLTVLISRSRDGEYISDFIKYFGLQVVRGSSKKGGITAFRQLLNHLHLGNCALLTVDGPRGPKYSIQPGAMALARKSNLPIIPVSLNALCRWNFKSWDGLQFPKPFSSVELVIGEPYYLPLDKDEDELKKLVYDHLMAITKDDA